MRGTGDKRKALSTEAPELACWRPRCAFIGGRRARPGGGRAGASPRAPGGGPALRCERIARDTARERLPFCPVDLDISTDWIPVVSGVVGAAGAVTAQVVAAIATGRRETKTANARRADARASAFADQKRDLFKKVLQAVDDTLADYDGLLRKFASGEGSISMPTGVLNHARWKGWAAEFDLLAPDVAKAVNACRRALFDFDMSVVFASHDEKALSDQEKEVRVKRAELRDAMRVSLGVTDPPRVGWLARVQARRERKAAEKQVEKKAGETGA